MIIEVTVSFQGILITFDEICLQGRNILLILNLFYNSWQYVITCDACGHRVTLIIPVVTLEAFAATPTVFPLQQVRHLYSPNELLQKLKTCREVSLFGQYMYEFKAGSTACNHYYLWFLKLGGWMQTYRVHFVSSLSKHTHSSSINKAMIVFIFRFLWAKKQHFERVKKNPKLKIVFVQHLHVWSFKKNEKTVNIVGLQRLINGPVLAVGNEGRGLDDPVALPEVSPPHMLISDLDDVSHRKPALLTIGQTAAFVPAWRKNREGGKER